MRSETTAMTTMTRPSVTRPNPTHPNTTRPTAGLARAFSLLELTLVLVIIGLLMAVAVVNLRGGAERARERTTRASMQVLKTQLDVYYAEKARLPETLEVLVADQYIEANTLTDGWKRPFYYLPHTDGQGTYDLVSAGKDGEFQTAEDNIDVTLLEVE